MFVSVKLNEKTYHWNTSYSSDDFDEMEQKCEYGSELTVTVIDHNGDFQIHIFDYLKTSPSQPRKWLLNNILFSLQDSKHKILFEKLYHEYTSLDSS